MHIEITIRDFAHLERVLPKLKELQPQTINITDKTGMVDNAIIAGEILSNIPKCNVVPHYALKNHTSRNKNVIIENFEEFIQQTTDSGVETILLVSGSPRPKFDSLSALNYCNTQHLLPKGVSFGVGYNPFLPEDRLILENERLISKLESGLVSSVYLQIGTLTKVLRGGVEYLRSLPYDVTIIPSLIIPNDNFIRKFKIRPWKDVYLDEKYLANTKNAKQKTQELYSIMRELELTPLLSIPDISKITINELLLH